MSIEGSMMAVPDQQRIGNPPVESEVSAMGSIAHALEALDEDAQVRVLHWAMGRINDRRRRAGLPQARVRSRP